MGIAIGAEHRELAEVARTFLEEKAVRGEHRSQLDASDDRIPPFWGAFGPLGWLGLHLPESQGGSGYGFPELGVVIEEMGRAATPGPFLPTVIVSALINERGDVADRLGLLPGLADGTITGGLGLHGSLRREDSSVAGDAGVVLSGSVADLLLLRVDNDMVALRSNHPGVSVIPTTSLDRGRRVARVSLSGVSESDLVVFPGSASRALQIARALASAEAAGAASACAEMAAEYAKARVAFGRPIGQFQAVKHHCANMFAQSEMALAASWDALRFVGEEQAAGLPVAAAAAVALPAALYCARLNIQVHGGIGFTWEHDAHLYFKRAKSSEILLGDATYHRELLAQRIGI
jgi:3-oxochol-4-en-24-oyl-CoA dehydrogenase